MGHLEHQYYSFGRQPCFGSFFKAKGLAHDFESKFEISSTSFYMGLAMFWSGNEGIWAMKNTKISIYAAGNILGLSNGISPWFCVNIRNFFCFCVW